MYGSEVPAVGWAELVLLAATILALLSGGIWALWRWDVGHEGNIRLPRSLEPGIREFVRAVDARDFEAAEAAVAGAFEFLESGDAAELRRKR